AFVTSFGGSGMYVQGPSTESPAIHRDPACSHHVFRAGSKRITKAVLTTRCICDFSTPRNAGLPSIVTSAVGLVTKTMCGGSLRKSAALGSPLPLGDERGCV